jgi:molecular chaperone DnaK
VRGEVEAALTELKRISENGSAAEVKAATDTLQAASYKLAETLYRATAPAGDASAPNGAAEGASTNGAGAEHEDVIDAEFKEAK